VRAELVQHAGPPVVGDAQRAGVGAAVQQRRDHPVIRLQPIDGRAEVRCGAAHRRKQQSILVAVDGSPETAQARDQLAKLADTLRSAIERASEEVRPELVNMLRQVNGELRRRANLDEDGPTQL